MSIERKLLNQKQSYSEVKSGGRPSLNDIKQPTLMYIKGYGLYWIVRFNNKLYYDKFSEQSLISPANITAHASTHYSGGSDPVSHNSLSGVHQDVNTTASPSFTGLTVGDGTNQTVFESDGTMKAEGDATTYSDLQFQIASGKVPAANFPTYETFTTNTRAYSFAVNDYIDLDSNELPHGWIGNESVELHLHITTKAANSTGSNRYAKFTLYVSYADEGSTWTETSFSAELTIPDGTSALQMFYLDLGDLDLSGYGIGTYLKLRIKRIAATGGTEYSGNIFLNQVGCHFRQDTIGSREETTK